MFIVMAMLAVGVPTWSAAQGVVGPDTVVVANGSLKLHALLWRPEGHGPFPAVLFNHGSGTTQARQMLQARTVGQAFAEHGYVLLFPFRRGSALSADQGTSAVDLLDREFAKGGQEARNLLQLNLLEGDHLSDALAALAFLRSLPEVDARRIAVAGVSFGGSLTLLVAERDPTLRAVICFSGSAASWAHAPGLRARLLAAVDRIEAPIYFLTAANDYSIAPAQSLSAELRRLGKPHRATIFPPVGQTPAEGHDFLVQRTMEWEPSVFAFLSDCMRR